MQMYVSRSRSQLIVLLLVFLLLITCTNAEISKASSVNTNHKVADSIKFEKGTFALSDVHLFPHQDAQMLTFTLLIKNESQTSIDFMDYWIKLQSNQGNNFTVNLLPEDKKKNTIAPNVVEQFHFYAKVGKENIEDFKFIIVKWDFSQANFERIIGQMKVSPDFTQNFSPDEIGQIDIDNVPFDAQIKNAVLNKNDKSYLPSIYLSLKNSGNRSVSLPELKYYIKTTSGYLYPLQTKNIGKDTKIQPLEIKEGILTGIIPNSVEQDNWLLVITKEITVDNIVIPIAIGSFEIKQSKTDEVSVGNIYTFTNENGTYSVRLNEIFRLPMDENDLIVADFDILNKGGQTLKEPVLVGAYKLQNAVNVETNFIKMEKKIAIEPDGFIKYQLVGKVPYTYKFDEINITLQEVKGEGDNKTKVDLLDFKHKSELMNIQTVPFGQDYALDDVGRESKYKINEVMRFVGITEDYLAVQLEIQNLGKRYSDLPQFVAHIKDADDRVMNVSMTKINTKLAPSGKAITYLYTPVPKDYKMNGMQLIWGDAVTKDKLSSKDEKPDAYVNPVSLAFPSTTKEPKLSLQDVNVFPYKIAFNKFRVTFDYIDPRVNLEFEYNLQRDMLMEASTTEHQIELVMKDPTLDFEYSQLIEFEKGDNSFKLGKHKMKISKSDWETPYGLDKMKKYTIELYHVFKPEGSSTVHKQLIAVQENNWRTISD